MNVQISYKASKSPDLEKEINHSVEKLRRRLAAFRPDLLHLRGNVESNNAREGTVVSLNLRLPSGQLASQEAGKEPVAVAKAAFDELLRQLARHKTQLRGSRRHPMPRRAARQKGIPQVPFEETMAAVHPLKVSGEDITSYVNANLEKLEHFVDRELLYRLNTGLLVDDLVTTEEVIDEAVAMALGDSEEKPELLSLERWLYRLALRAISRVAKDNGEALGTHVPLEMSARKQNVRATDDSELQYHQPDELILREDVIADARQADPEQEAARDEMITLTERALLGTSPQEREAFILYAIEGFTLEEIAATTDRKLEDVKRSIESARERVKEKVPASAAFRDKLLQHSKTA